MRRLICWMIRLVSRRSPMLRTHNPLTRNSCRTSSRSGMSIRLSCDTRFIRDRCAKRTLSTRTASRNALTRATRKRSPFRNPSMAPMIASLRTDTLQRTKLPLPPGPGNSHHVRIHSFCTVLGRILSAESRPDSRRSVKVSLQPGPILLATAPTASASSVAAAQCSEMPSFTACTT